MSYAKYLTDLMNLWASWSKSRYQRKYLYMSLGMVIALGVAISFIPYMHYVGVPVAFLLISGYDWLKRRKQELKRQADTLAWYHREATVQQNEGGAYTGEDDDHPEDFDDELDELQDTTELHLDGDFNECDCGHDHGAEFGEAPNDGSGVRE